MSAIDLKRGVLYETDYKEYIGLEGNSHRSKGVSNAAKSALAVFLSDELIFAFIALINGVTEQASSF